LNPTNDFEGADQIFVYYHHGTIILEIAAIIWRREYCNELPLGKELIPVLDYLMSSTNQVELIPPVKLGHNLSAEGIRHAALVRLPAVRVFVWIRPQQIAE